MEYIILIIILVVVITIISIINNLNRNIVKIEEAASSIDIALQNRYDILIKMMDTVKSYVKNENSTLFEIVNLRKGMSTKEKTLENEKMNHNIEKINVVAESYPELKASENYKVLQEAILEVEEELQAARRMYNSNVSILNQMIVSFPCNIIANMQGIHKRDFFEVEESKKQDVKIEL